MEPTEKDINDLRSSFFKRCGEEKVISLGTFHQNDISRARNDDDWIRRFLLHHDNDHKEALNMLMETCDWRKKFGTNDINEKNVNLELLESGSMFPHGKDRDGKTLLIFKSKKHVKGTYNFEDIKRVLVYWMERLERQEKGDMISVFFDMDGAGYSNMDMDYTKYIISLFKNYYPYFLNYIIIFEMAWVLNAAFKVIKTWLPPKAIRKIKFVSKTNLKDLVDPENALRSWGGFNDYVYSFEPEERAVGEPFSAQDECKKKVHFADKSPILDYACESGFIEPTFPKDASTIVNHVKLAVNPCETLPFSYDGNDLKGSITLKNDDLQCVSFKVKTTSPKKFRVRPSLGVLSPDETVVINVVLLTGYESPGLNRDKFLIMSLPVQSNDMTPEVLHDLWKSTPEEEVHGFKLRCSLSESKPDGAIVNGSAFASHTPDDQKLTKVTSDMLKLQSAVCGLREEVKVVQRQQWIIAAAILFLACIIAYISGNKSGSQRSENSCWVMNSTI
ncbi:UNVERIFIED_CONTAM: hypothetical protein PYX00_001464 [Menopon gallinae]|uniref:Motile sperm domain-containing protein 2 n=1 Tax=Menopon gallinae TaxID=328185 RepID=A0AAW2ID04_9NEOP